MKSLYAVFPNLTIKSPCQFWGINFVGVHSQVFKESGELSAVVKWDFENNNEEKAAMRQLNVLRSHLMVAAYLLGRDPVLYCKILKWQEGVYESQVSKIEQSLPLRTLVDHLPKDLENSAKTTSWFSRYLEHPSNDESNLLMYLYNAFGTLPGGFNSILNSTSRQDDKLILQALLNRIQDFHDKENSDEGYNLKTLPFSYETIIKLEKCYIRALLSAYPGFRS